MTLRLTRLDSPTCLWQAGIADVALHKDMPSIADQRGQVLTIASVGEQGEVDDRFIGLGKPVQNEIRADKTGAPGNKNAHWLKCL